MKIKTNKTGAFVILPVLFVLCICFAFMFDSGAVTASAATATTPKYNLQFAYTKKTTTGTGGGTSSSTTTGTVYSVYVQTAASSGATVSASIYGSSSSGTGDFEIGSYINSSTVNILINSSLSSGTIKVTDSSGTQVGSGSKSLTLTGLADGKYNIEFYFGGGAWTTSSRSGTSVSVSATSSFYVDGTSPTISGASTSTTGKYTNAAFTVSASDSGSGVAALYYKTPGSSSYSSVSASKTFPAGSTNGLYTFYAKDNAGNQSSYYYVYYDDVKPTGVIKNSSGTTITTSYTNGAFSYTASDSGSGVSYLQYMTPSSSSWVSYTSGTTIAATATNGKYQFRAVDKAGNISNTAIMYLDTVKPVGVLYSGTTAVSSGTKSTASYIKYVASDALSGIKTVYMKLPSSSSYVTYTSGSQMTINGTYYFYCVDNTGNVSDTVTISLDNIKPTLSISNGNFGDTLSDSFSVTATDNIGGTTLYFKAPNGSNFVKVSGTTMSVSKIMPDGTYQFYAVDGYGNTSATYSVTLSIAAPVAQIIQASNGTKRCIIWTDSNCSGVLDGESYVNGTWISTEGSHSFVLTNDAQRSSTYTFTIDHYYKVSSVVSPTCTDDGYTV